MTRAGLAFAALGAAAITAGSLGFAVFWAYAPRDVPPVATEAPPDAGPAPAVPSPSSPEKPAPGAIAAVPEQRPGPVPQSAVPAAPSQPAATQENAAALTQPAGPPRESKPVASEPQIGVIRGGRRAPARPRVRDEPKLAGSPPSGAVQTATDAQSILVLRGGRGTRYAVARAAEPSPSPELLLVVIRGARPRPAIFAAYVQPSALILHIPR